MTKPQIFFTIFIGFLLSSSLSFGYSRPENCKRMITHRENLQFSLMYQKNVAECWFSVHPMNGYENMIYRSYTVTSGGHLFIFNSYGVGPSEKTTGAREYYFFPRETYTNGIQLADDLVSIRINSKLTLQFETQNLYPLNGPNIVFKNFLSVNPKNAGGVEVLKYNGVYLDTGFLLGQQPSGKKKNKSMFKNQFGQKCIVENQMIFDYKEDNPILLHDMLLYDVVANRCPDFRWVD